MAMDCVSGARNYQSWWPDQARFTPLCIKSSAEWKVIVEDSWEKIRDRMSGPLTDCGVNNQFLPEDPLY